MLRLDWRCVRCLTELPDNVRADAYFCQASASAPPKPGRREKTKDPDSPCRKIWYARKLQVRKSSPAIAHLEQVLGDCAKVACWYRLAWYADDGVWLYPAVDRKTMRFDRALRHTPGFRIHPFEPPVVPRQSEYSVLYYDWEGNLVDTPRDPRTAAELAPGESFRDYSQFQAEPVAIISVESGQRWNIRDQSTRQQPPERIARRGATTYRFPYPPLATQVLEQRPAHARSYILVDNVRRLSYPLGFRTTLPLHPFISPPGVPDGEFPIDYADANGQVIESEQEACPMVTIQRATPPGPPLSRPTADTPRSSGTLAAPRKDNDPKPLSKREEAEIVHLVEDNQLREVAFLEIELIRSGRIAEPPSALPPTLKVSDEERARVRAIVRDPRNAPFLSEQFNRWYQLAMAKKAGS